MQAFLIAITVTLSLATVLWHDYLLDRRADFGSPVGRAAIVVGFFALFIAMLGAAALIDVVPHNLGVVIFGFGPILVYYTARIARARPAK